MEQDTLVVIPCFNEARRLRVDSFVELLDTTPSVGLLFVDDGSSDDTPGLLKRIESTRPQAVQVLSLGRNCGKAEAVRTGLNAALAHGARYVAYWDADCSTSLTQVDPFRRVLESRPELVAVTGARIRRLGTDVRRDPRRHYLGRVFATLASLTLGLPVYDTQCGAKMFRANDLVRDLFATPFVSHWIFDVEILGRLVAAVGDPGKAANLVYEYPLAEWHDVAGSKLGAGHMLAALRDLLRIRRLYRQ
jgi:dolichyl-phosphate beta-glucosyltransferase